MLGISNRLKDAKEFFNKLIVDLEERWYIKLTTTQ